MRRAKGEFYPGAGDRVAGSPKLRGPPHECGKLRAMPQVRQTLLPTDVPLEWVLVESSV